LKKVRLLECLNNIDNEMVERAIETDSKEKLQELKKLEKNKKYSFFFKYFNLFAGGLAVILIGIFVVNNFNTQNHDLITTPPLDAKSLQDLEKYLNMDLSKYEIKEIEEVILYEESDMGEIIYKDGSSFRISKGNTDNSGMYDGTLMRELEYNNINVKIYELDNTKYAIWQSNNYSYSYIFSESEDNLDILNKIV